MISSPIFLVPNLIQNQIPQPLSVTFKKPAALFLLEQVSSSSLQLRLDDLDQNWSDLLRDEGIPLAVRMHPIPRQHGIRHTCGPRTVRHRDGALRRRILSRPARNLRVHRLNRGVAPAGRDHLINDDAHVGIGGAEGGQDGGVGIKDGVGVALADVDVVGAEHKVDDVGCGAPHPAGDVVARYVVGLVARVAFVAGVEAGRLGAAAGDRVHGADELDRGGEVGGCELRPYLGTPAGDFRDGVAEEHWEVRVSMGGCENGGRLEWLLLTDFELRLGRAHGGEAGDGEEGAKLHVCDFKPGDPKSW